MPLSLNWVLSMRRLQAGRMRRGLICVPPRGARLLKLCLPSYLSLHHYKSTPIQQKSLFPHTSSFVIKQMADSMSSPYSEHEDALMDVCWFEYFFVIWRVSNLTGGTSKKEEKVKHLTTARGSVRESTHTLVKGECVKANTAIILITFSCIAQSDINLPHIQKMRFLMRNSQQGHWLAMIISSE